MQKVTGVEKTGTASVILNNFASEEVGQKDELRLPLLQIPLGIDSVFLSFQIAAATYTSIDSVYKAWDTLEVLVSTDYQLQQSV